MRSICFVCQFHGLLDKSRISRNLKHQSLWHQMLSFFSKIRKTCRKEEPPQKKSTRWFRIWFEFGNGWKWKLFPHLTQRDEMFIVGLLTSVWFIYPALCLYYSYKNNEFICYGINKSNISAKRIMKASRQKCYFLFGKYRSCVISMISLKGSWQKRMTIQSLAKSYLSFEHIIRSAFVATRFIDV